MLTDPTGGLGYAFGARLPSADVNTVFTQQPNAWDIVGGGTYTVATSTTLNKTGSPTLTMNLPATWQSRLTVSGDDFYLSTGAMVMDAAAFIQYSPARSVVRRVHQLCAHVAGVSDQGSSGVSDWAYAGVSGSGGGALTGVPTQRYVNVASSTQPAITFDLTPFLSGGSITAVEVKIDPAGAAAAPATLPLWELWRSDSDLSDNLIDTQTDPGGGSYRTAHPITKTLGTPYAFDPDGVGETVYLTFRGEAGADATAGLLVRSIKITQSMGVVLP